MDVYEAIIHRRTIRQFKSTPIKKDILIKLIEAARLAPSGANLQPCEYIIVDKPRFVAQVFTTLKWAGYIAPAGDPAPGRRPAVYIVVLINTRINKNAEHDAAAGIENIILTACSVGIGSCWVVSVDRKTLRRILQIPDNFKIDSVLALGYPDERPVAEEMKDSVKYYKDKRGQLHVPKRKLKDILHRNNYGLSSTSRH